MGARRRLSEGHPGIKKGPVDWYLLIPVLLLVSIGIIMVLSASSAVTASKNVNNVYFFFYRHLAWVAIGLAGLIVAARIDYYKLKNFAMPGFIIAVILLVAVLFSSPINGARSWIPIGGYQFQPSELVKVLMVIILARMMSQKQQKIRNFNEGFLPVLLVIGVIWGLILLERDLGTAMAIAMTAFIMLFAGGGRMNHLLGLASAGIPLAIVAVLVAPYRMRRFITFWDPWADKSDAGYQITQSLFAIGSGGLFGVGLGKSLQKYKYLPEQHTDFIFSILAEETGFLGGIFVILLFVFFAARAYRVAKNCPDSFGSLLAAGLTSIIMVEALMNIAVATSSMPVTGVTLPFISFGGSSLIFKLTGVGILLNISRYCQEPVKVVKLSRSANSIANGIEL